MDIEKIEQTNVFLTIYITEKTKSATDALVRDVNGERKVNLTDVSRTM